MDCTYAPDNTYGHECGCKATHVAVKKDDRAVSGFFYGGRCDKHLKATGKDNQNVIRMEVYNGHTNSWI